MVDYALQYAGRGWRVFPLQGKIPYKGTSGFKEATTDPAMIEWRWSKWPDANIGLATGNGLIVLDVDGPDGLAELKAWIAAHGALPATLASRTGNGAHLFFAYDGDDIRSSARGNLHVRGAGGYAVLPPSLHPNGRRYEWIDGSVTVAKLPDRLKEWMLSGGRASVNGSSPLRRVERPAYLERLCSRGLASTALQALSQAESTWSPQEQKRIESALKAIP
ncbi:MAG: bifunctional DNA primase/polymerase, partial [Bradyrhizobium sp.]|nr:bifunctional DNA primase/polymerase [Bradyrhizobium sp.]